MTRAEIIAAAEAYVDDGGFEADLARRVAIPTESQNPDRAAAMTAYIDDEMRRSLEAPGGPVVPPRQRRTLQILPGHQQLWHFGPASGES